MCTYVYLFSGQVSMNGVLDTDFIKFQDAPRNPIVRFVCLGQCLRGCDILLSCFVPICTHFVPVSGSSWAQFDSM